MKIQLLLLIVASALLGSLLATSCGTFTCGSSDQCCTDSVIGSVCYNPSTHSCAFIQGLTLDQQKFRLCGKDEQACTLFPLFGSPIACFNPQTHSCVLPQGGLVSFRRALCGRGLEFCGFSAGCFDPAQYRCCRQDFICRIGTPGCC